MKMELTEVCKGSFILDENGEGLYSEHAWECWGDCQNWHIEVFHAAIIKRYGEGSAGPLRKGEDGVWFFNHLSEVDWGLIGDDIGVSQSESCSSSSSNSEIKQPVALTKLKIMSDIKEFEMRVVASDGPAFGCYLGGSAADGEAVICLNVKLCLNVDKDPKGCLSESLAHEVLHACQEVMGLEVTEKDVVDNLARIEEVEFEVSEDDEQMIQGMTAEIQRLGERVIELEGELSKK